MGQNNWEETGGFIGAKGYMGGCSHFSEEK